MCPASSQIEGSDPTDCVKLLGIRESHVSGWGLGFGGRSERLKLSLLGEGWTAWLNVQCVAPPLLR